MLILKTKTMYNNFLIFLFIVKCSQLYSAESLPIISLEHTPEEIQQKILTNIFPENNFILNCSYENFLGSPLEIRKILTIKLPSIAFISKNFYQMCNDKKFCIYNEQIRSIIFYFITYINNLDANYKITFNDKRKILILKNLKSLFLKQKQLPLHHPFLYSVIEKQKDIDYFEIKNKYWFDTIKQESKKIYFIQELLIEDIFELIYYCKEVTKNNYYFLNLLSIIAPLCENQQKIRNLIQFLYMIKKNE